MKFLVVFIFSFAMSEALAAGKAEVAVNLTPAGDFKAKTSEVTGHAIKKGDEIIAENVIVKLQNLKTGISLRDKHARDKYLKVKDYPEITLLKATGKNGKGKGRVKYRGIEKDIEGTYSIKGQKLVAAFPLRLSDFKITGIKYMGVGVEDEVMVNVEIPVMK